ncbi:unnamed protein product, partial [Polarella glacialis]
AHAALELRSTHSGQGWSLFIEDTSANGTWVNGTRLIPGSAKELRPKDRISFLPAAHAFYPDALMYEVEELPASAVVPPQREAERDRARRLEAVLQESRRGQGGHNLQLALPVGPDSAPVPARKRRKSSGTALPSANGSEVVDLEADEPGGNGEGDAAAGRPPSDTVS